MLPKSTTTTTWPHPSLPLHCGAGCPATGLSASKWLVIRSEKSPFVAAGCAAAIISHSSWHRGHRLRRPRPIAPGDEGRNARRPYGSLYGPWSGALTAVGQFDDDVDFEAVEVAEVEVEVEVEQREASLTCRTEALNLQI